jgi:cell wall-associated NlpC family hydrolase
MWCNLHRPSRLLALAACFAASARLACAQTVSIHVQAASIQKKTSESTHLVATKNLTPVPPLVPVHGKVEGTQLVRTARRFLGVPYRLGGTTPRAFDCSGFVRYVYALHGIGLPRTAHEQAAIGQAPAPGDTLEAGDLLFFWGGHGAQHIAIYVGHDSIIHASSSGHKVRLDHVESQGRRSRSWFNQRLIAVRRILPREGVWYEPSVSGNFSLIAPTNPNW